MLIFWLPSVLSWAFGRLLVERIERFVWLRREKIRGSFRAIAGLPLSRRGFNRYLINVVVTEVLLESYTVADNMPVEYTNIACEELFFFFRSVRIVTRNAKADKAIESIVIYVVADNTDETTKMLDIYRI